MKTALLLALVLSAFAHLFGQTSNLSYGEYSVGYLDTVIYNHSEHYSFGSYSGPKPYFINIWLPSNEIGPHNVYREFLKYSGSWNVADLADSVFKMQMTSVLDFGVLENLDNDERPGYGDKLLEKIMADHVMSGYPITMSNNRFPTVVYHHGNGGVPFENNLLFEYLASHGIVVISAYYHWPNQEAHTYPKALEDVDFVARFAAKAAFVDSEKLYYWGHSWGGGVGLRMNQRQSVAFKKYIVFDSSIEHYGLEEFSFIYPSLDSLFRNHASEFVGNTIVFSARYSYQKDNGERVINPFPRYLPYKFFNQEFFTYYTLKDPLNHGQFTSLGVIRAPYANDFDFLDKKSLLAQTQNYLYLIRLAVDVLSEKAAAGDRHFKFNVD